MCYLHRIISHYHKFSIIYCCQHFFIKTIFGFISIYLCFLSFYLFFVAFLPVVTKVKITYYNRWNNEYATPRIFLKYSLQLVEIKTPKITFVSRTQYYMNLTTLECPIIRSRYLLLCDCLKFVPFFKIGYIAMWRVNRTHDRHLVCDMELLIINSNKVSCQCSYGCLREFNKIWFV